MLNIIWYNTDSIEHGFFGIVLQPSLPMYDKFTFTVIE